jgi:REP element-mobilizing transposase RayT
MTIAEMHDLADLLIDKANAPWFSPDEKDRFINLAINEYVKNKYRKFEIDEKVREDLLTLVSEVYSVNNTDLINLEIVPDFLFALRLEMDVNSVCGLLTGVPITPMQQDDFSESQRDPFNKATDKYPQYLQNTQAGNRTIQVYSDVIPTQVRMIYLRQPVEVDINTPTDSDLPDHTHEEIVNLAVRKMLATIEGFENYQAQINEINNQE